MEGEETNPETESEGFAVGDFLTNPAVVDHIHIHGLQRTKSDIIVQETKDILTASTFGQVLALSLEARMKLQNLGIFKDVDLLIDTSSGSPSAYDITLNVKEKRFITSSAGTQVGNNEGNMVFGCRLNNVFGRAEGLKADLSFGTKTKTSYQLSYFKPLPKNPERRFFVGAHKSTTEFPQSSHQEASQGFNVNLMVPGDIGDHQVTWDGTWREVMGMSPTASFDVREQAGHSLKSSLKYTFEIDERDSPSYPSEGYLIKLCQEFAGIGGDAKFLKHNFEVQKNVEVMEDVVLSGSIQGGILKPLFGVPSKINDRLFLGGPLSIRGFQPKGIGPRSEGDSLGGDAFWAAGLHLFTPLPFRPGRHSFGERIKTHLFVNAGNLVNLEHGLPWRSRLQPLGENIRWSYGAGLVLLLGIARLEVNYCVPGGTQSSDSINHGLQVGVGINFL